LENIFDSFQQSQTGREIGGTGLGLAIESMVDAATIHKNELLRLKPGSPPVRILIADDIADNRKLLRTMLESACFEVREAIDGIETLAAV
jgi:PleD family two-component response regulator